MLSSSSKLRTISVMCANLFVLMMFLLVSSRVIITFLHTKALSSLPINLPSGSSFSSFVINLLAPNWIREVNPFLSHNVSDHGVHFKMFKYKVKERYEPNRGRYLQIVSRKDLYDQTIVISSEDTFPARFQNIFVDYPLGEMRVGDKTQTNWNKAPLRL